MLQAVAGLPASPPLPPLSVTARPCPAGDDGEITVCARKSDPPRLVKLPEERVASPQDRMTFRLPGHATGNVHAFQRDLQGATSQGAAVTIRVPFGKGKKD
ncbi:MULTISPECIES: hypothetical protein [unclassified Sphingomonas]|uniref:hypothetical protein n=1 Tax=unclassified Sphingomonas TaxID=196159 RepID=UPI001F59B8EA|nr:MULTISPECIES: hypothetical protein [unclassified Sphingomonas]